MDALTLATTAASTTAAYSSLHASNPLFPPLSHGVRRTSRRRQVNYPRKTKFVVFAAQDDPKFDQWDQMELQFGRMLGEDPKLTLAKIMARKANPDVSFLEVEKQFYKNKGKIVEIKELPFEGSKGKKASNSLDGLNLVKPVPKGGFEFPMENKPRAPAIKKPNRPVAKPLDTNTKPSVPNVMLRKPALYVEDDVEDLPSKSRARVKQNSTLKMREDQSYAKFSDLSLLRKPEPSTLNRNQGSLDNEEAKRNDASEFKAPNVETEDEYNGFTLLKKPTKSEDGESESLGTGKSSVMEEQEPEHILRQGMQPLDESNIESIKEHTDENSVVSSPKFPVDAALLGKPKRLEKSVKEPSTLSNEEKNLANPEKVADDEFINLPPTSTIEDADWSRAEDLLRTGNRAEVELVSASPRGFIVSFGSLVGFLPYRNLAAKWKFLAFESWLRQKGLDPSLYKQNIGTVGSFDSSEQSFSVDPNLNSEINQENGEEVTPDMKLEDLLRIYDQEKLKFLSSFVGKKTKANIIVADKRTRTFTVSLRPKEKEELIMRKRNLMTRLQIGDIVKCCIKKISYFGIFVEVEGVPALIHQTEVSWDATLDPASYFRVGQIVEAKVHHLDFSLERIFLSLKEITPDPMIEALESAVDNSDSWDGQFQAAEPDSEWPEVESLIEQLQKIEGIQSVSKGCFSLSPGLAPTFQVYMASMIENQYKLLARAGNKVQEVNISQLFLHEIRVLLMNLYLEQVIVESSLDKEVVKSTIFLCTNRV